LTAAAGSLDDHGSKVARLLGGCLVRRSDVPRGRSQPTAAITARPLGATDERTLRPAADLAFDAARSRRTRRVFRRDGALTQDRDAFQTVNPLALGNPWAVGSCAYVQSWFRDPASCETTSLSNDLELTYQP
jgi:hypothetical protein